MAVRVTHRALIALGATLLTGGCDLRYSAVLDPKGPIALAERDLLFDAFFVMLIVVVPVIILVLWFAWRYRATNTTATYAPTWSYSARVDAVVWLIPALIVIALGVLLWRSTYKLDPYRALVSSSRPLEVQVVAQDWKWLFIYPEQGVAVVNQLAFPAGRPLSLKITSDTVMNSFYVPQLAGQIYAMAGMQTRLQILADQPGKFVGRNSQYSGAGFPDQYFEVIATTPTDFDAWVAKARQATVRLDAQTYPALAAKSRGHAITYYSAVEPGLYDSIVAKYTHGGHAQHAPARR
ncbi:MAG: ubiquinol oxidase subunit II [Rhodospirillales bacterium]|nr:ubiquinol oxidase subunit II [Rhodospirillales bacterium]